VTPLRSLIAQGGTATFTREELQAERPSIRELREAAFKAAGRGEWDRVRAYQSVIYGRLEDARNADEVRA
jgi:hypothetical protein